MAHPAYRSREYQRNRKLLLASKPPCFRCGGVATTADHILPKSRGGGPELTNLRPACRRCNSSRGNRTVTREANGW